MKQFFSFEGRIGRRQYWLTCIVGVIVTGIAGVMIDEDNPLGLFLLIPGIWLMLATYSKRWHDRNKSGWWSLILAVPYLGPIWGLIELGLLKGNNGSNRFGEDPLGAASAPPPVPNPAPRHTNRPPPVVIPPTQSPPKSAPRKTPPQPKSAAIKSEKPKKKVKDSAPPVTVVPIDSNASIQKMVKTAGDTLEIFPPCEFPGPLTIDRPITLDFGNSTLWAIKGPVLTVKGSKVCIRNAHIEVTGSMDAASDDEVTAIRVEGRGKITFENVKVHGRVKGVKGEDGHWPLPRSLALGTLAAGEPHEFRMRLEVPAECELLPEGPVGLSIYPQKLSVGDQEVILQFEGHLNGHFSTQIMVATQNFKRRIALNACFCDPSLNPAAIKGQGQIIYPLAKVSPVQKREERVQKADNPAAQPGPEAQSPEREQEQSSRRSAEPPPPPPPAIEAPAKGERPPEPEPVFSTNEKLGPPKVAPRPPRIRIHTQPSIPMWAGGLQTSNPNSTPENQPEGAETSTPQSDQEGGPPSTTGEPIGETVPLKDSKRIVAKPGKAFGI